MRPPLLLLLAGLAITTAGTLIADALDFGGVAWLAALIVMLLAISLVDRERFYGPRDPRDHTHSTPHA